MPQVAAAPGVRTQLRFDLGEGEIVVLPAPAGATPGDLLRLAKDAQGDWSCSLAAAAPAAAEARVLRCTVPAGAVPGETRLQLSTGKPGETLAIVVPDHARPGDVIELKRSPGEHGQWSARIVEPTAAPTSAPKTLELSPIAAAVDDQSSACERLVAAARAAGAQVSGKLQRGAAPPLNIMGMVASQDVQSGETLFELPEALLLSAENCERRMPEVYGAVQRLELIPPGRRREAAHAACLAVLLRDAEVRWSKAGCSSGEAPAAAACGPSSDAIGDVWARYADMLLGESFSQHPYWRALEDAGAVTAALEPSEEHGVVGNMAMDVLSMFRCIDEHSDVFAGAPPVSAGTYLHAHLSILSRVFDCAGGSPALVPVTDLCNHDPDPGAQWDWDPARRAHVVTALRAHSAGEEVKISYGQISNVLLFRTYGFTLPPAIEPSWACVIQRVKPKELYARFLPVNLCNQTIHLDTCAMQHSLIVALNGCADHGSDPAEFLRELCRWSLERFDSVDSSRKLGLALAALKRRRAVAPESAAWWEEMAAQDEAESESAAVPRVPSSLGPHWEEAALRVQMSEFLCLLAHLEVLASVGDSQGGCANGNASASPPMLAGAQGLRDQLSECLEILRRGDRLGLVNQTPCA
eukprot:TRINITY_DN23679_c0_g5_i1.p1 TRINITY_DN23679_c0_g5~~TRINITY_DN23679_c0_g5_i1.p1  ORF type:complete len:680 (+),score=157.28 TRINITY_DN23679_c0_g5_i1:128-2041(+)